MFLSNKYTNIYGKLIKKAQDKNRCKCDCTYYERHHIYPKFIGGKDKACNLVFLTPREHYIAHALLVNMVDDKFLSKAIMSLMMLSKVNPHNKDQRIMKSIRLYELLHIKVKRKVYNISRPLFARKKPMLKTRGGSYIRSRLDGDSALNTQSLAARASMSNAAKKRKYFSCEYCGKSVQKAQLSQWHGDKCKMHPSRLK